MRSREQSLRPRQNSSRSAVDITVASALWQAEPKAKAILRRAIAEAAFAVAAIEDEVAVVLTDDADIRKLNRVWRRKNCATNVLSFPARPAALGSRLGKTLGPAPRMPGLLGDIVIAYETTEREARAERKPFGHHLAHLAVHGFLHLVGYDHETRHEAETMEALETAILARLDVPDPYNGLDSAPDCDG
jgi:probable rRNA maturation factor